MKIGYARVSTQDQKLDLQLKSLKTAGCQKIFREKISGFNRQRPEFQRMLDQIRPDDIIVVWKLDRLARSTRDLLNTMETINEAGGKFQSISEPWANTTTHAGKMIMTIFAGDGLYRLRNVPFLAYGYSEQDVVKATEVDGHLIVSGVAERSGHSTYRLFFPEATENEKFRPLWEPFAKLGCTFERANSRLIGVDVPPDTDVYAVYAVLEQGEQAKHWTFEEGHCGHRLRT